MKIPKKISPDPIIDAVVELRFEREIHPDAVFGVISKVVKDDFKSFQSLPIRELPDKLRNSDPNLRHSPHFQSLAGDYKLNIGPNAISLANINKYHGWADSFFPKINKLLSQIKKSDVVTHFNRIGLRYIDFFDEDIFKSINLSITMGGKEFDAFEKQFTTVQDKGNGILARVHITNNARVTKDNKTFRHGSIIDTDTFFEPAGGLTFDKLSETIDNCHNVANQTFYSLLKQEFINSRNPDYGDL